MAGLSGRRARTLAEFDAVRGSMFEADEVMAGIASYKPRPTDVIISPYGKCGTTWLQQTFHTLRTRGDMDFDDISRVVPWIETAGGLKLDINAEQRANPRGFKSHLPFDALPMGARYVVSFRDPKDALVSFYHFMVGWMIEPGTVTLEEFGRDWMARGASGPISYWQHLLSWWNARENPDVLLFSYEHMCDAPEAHIRKLASFCGLPLDDALLALTRERTSIAYMLQYKDRFDDALMRGLSERRGGLPPGSDSAKVRKGGAGGHKQEMSADLAAALDAVWAEQIAPATGFADYAALDAELRRRFAA